MAERRRINITEQLGRWTDGDRDAFVPEIYEVLCHIASKRLRVLGAGHSLEPASVVNEAYVRLSSSDPVKWTNRRHFYGCASRLMKFVVRDYCRARGAQKRGGALIRIVLDSEAGPDQSRDATLTEIDDCLEELARMDKRQARIMEMRFFGGLTVVEVAEALKISEATVKRNTQSASAWIKAQLTKK